MSDSLLIWSMIVSVMPNSLVIVTHIRPGFWHYRNNHRSNQEGNHSSGTFSCEQMAETRLSCKASNQNGGKREKTAECNKSWLTAWRRCDDENIMLAETLDWQQTGQNVTVSWKTAWDKFVIGRHRVRFQCKRSLERPRVKKVSFFSI